jgi:hypothetical protein
MRPVVSNALITNRDVNKAETETETTAYLPLAAETAERLDLRLPASLAPRFRFLVDTRLSKVSSSLSDNSLHKNMSSSFRQID